MTQPHEQLEREQQREYSQYVATETIWINGARAFNVGHPVPASHVTDGKVREDQVAKTTTKAGQAALQTQES